MITATGNNFGTGEILFKDYQDNGLLILNGSFAVDATSKQYLQTELMEIYVPDMQISRSTYSSVFLICNNSPMPYGTILKAWVKDKNTICIEPYRIFDTVGELTILFSTAFVTKGQHRKLEMGETLRPTIVDPAGKCSLDFSYYQHLKVSPNGWTYVSLLFEKFQASAPDIPFEFTISGLPEDTDAAVVVVLAEMNQSEDLYYCYVNLMEIPCIVQVSIPNTIRAIQGVSYRHLLHCK